MYKLRSRWRFTSLVIVIWLVYVGIALITPQSQSTSKYHLSRLALDGLLISVTLPYLICWLYAISGWVHFREFTRKQVPGVEREGFTKLTYGLFVLVISIIAPTVISTVYLYFSRNSRGAGWNIFNNYLGILIPLISFLFMFLGSAQIASPIQPKITKLARTTTVLFPVALFSVFYLAMIFTNPGRQVSPDPTVPATYFLPDSMILATIVLPVIVTWLLGLLLVLNLEHFSHFSKTINRVALVNFYNGIIIIVAVTILEQVLASLGGNRFSHLSLSALLALVYVLLAILTFGFGLIAHGAKKLGPANVSTNTT